MFYHGNYTIYCVATDPSNNVAEHLKAVDDVGIIPTMDLTNDKRGEQIKSNQLLQRKRGCAAKKLQPNYKTKEWECEKINNASIREHVDIDSMPFGFMEGRGTASSFFLIPRQLQEEHLNVEKQLQFASKILSTELIWRAMGKPGVQEWLTRWAQCLNLQGSQTQHAS